MYAVYSGDSNNNAAASACEPLTVTPATGVPEFPVGIFALMGIMVPALLLLRKRSISGSPMAS